MELQYVSCADPVTLQEVALVSDSALLSLAAFVRETRLIDNIFLQSGSAAAAPDKEGG